MAWVGGLQRKEVMPMVHKCTNTEGAVAVPYVQKSGAFASANMKHKAGVEHTVALETSRPAAAKLKLDGHVALTAARRSTASPVHTCPETFLRRCQADSLQAEWRTGPSSGTPMTYIDGAIGVGRNGWQGMGDA